MAAMRIFETWPPSSAVISVCVALVTVIFGLEFAVTFLAGVGTMRFGIWLDTHGLPPSTSRRRT